MQTSTAKVIATIGECHFHLNVLNSICPALLTFAYVGLAELSNPTYHYETGVTKKAVTVRVEAIIEVVDVFLLMRIKTVGEKPVKQSLQPNSHRRVRNLQNVAPQKQSEICKTRAQCAKRNCAFEIFKAHCAATINANNASFHTKFLQRKERNRNFIK